MNMPGFNAEASLFNVSTRYQATTEISFYGGIVLPAQFSDVFDPHRQVPFLSTQLFDPYPPVLCLRWVCLEYNPDQPWRCKHWFRSVGVLVDGVCV